MDAWNMSFGSYLDYLKHAIEQEQKRNEQHVKQCLMEIDAILNKDKENEWITSNKFNNNIF